MLAVGRAMMLRPRLMLLDEPSFGLAPLIVEELFGILRTLNKTEKVSMLLVEQNAALALELADHAYLIETGRLVMEGPAQQLRDDENIRKRLPRVLRANMELFLHQVLAGLATGGIYACMALAVVMIYQAIDHLNFAQGEMAMFSTFIAWQLIQWGLPYWLAFGATIVISFAAGVLIERVVLRPIHDAPVLSHVVAFIALLSILNSAAGFMWDWTIKSFASPFGSGQFLGQNLINKHDAGMIGVTLLMLVLLYLFFRHTRIGLAMRAAAANPESRAARRHPRRLDDGARLGHGGGDRLGRRHADRACGVPRTQHDAEHPALRLRWRGGRRSHQSGRRGVRRLPQSA